jgi:hypothetical protein
VAVISDAPSGLVMSVILTQGFASGFTLGYCPAPLRGSKASSSSLLARVAHFARMVSWAATPRVTPRRAERAPAEEVFCAKRTQLVLCLQHHCGKTNPIERHPRRPGGVRRGVSQARRQERESRSLGAGLGLVPGVWPLGSL